MISVVNLSGCPLTFTVSGIEGIVQPDDDQMPRTALGVFGPPMSGRLPRSLQPKAANA